MEVVEPTVIASQATVFYDRFIEVEETGDYYIGIRGVSDPDKFYIYVDEFSISAPASKAAPEGVSDVRIKTYGDGRKDADISFRAPSLATGGSQLQDIDRIEVKRDGELVKTFDDVAVGGTLSFTDNVPMASNAYTWTFTAYNGHGAGKSVDVQAYVGINVPGKCGNVRISETGETGMVTVSWDAPATDVEGYPFDPDKCTYTLTRYDGGQLIPVADGLETLSHTFRAIPEGGSQAFLRYAVKAVSKRRRTGMLFRRGACRPLLQSAVGGIVQESDPVIDIRCELSAGDAQHNADRSRTRRRRAAGQGRRIPCD